MGFVAHVEGEERHEKGRHVKSPLEPYFLDLDNKTICLHGKHSSLKAGSSIRPVQSLQL